MFQRNTGNLLHDSTVSYPNDKTLQLLLRKCEGETCFASSILTGGVEIWPHKQFGCQEKVDQYSGSRL
jgi:hypothetical protein